MFSFNLNFFIIFPISENDFVMILQIAANSWGKDWGMQIDNALFLL